ncbi:Phosphoglucomutase @ Phosphomannomutase [Bathymodiolus heckerae thiotrophic gill symbiont]|uniref:phosphomannomutase/phosphoglucomutase n=1 Tax=Bathymodiolus heckerae thiotrophic gill symbiont TaxID=1052212 RepID=UPI0010B903C6|nr:phosphomannomutase/phosphoglucomutase [Bathymodiolus heckerae thiotrophic gill symbiont]CAC9588819.1 Phosphoglucomutase (EC 5.4.2.2) @ Phosphomannomutase (EC 5.4.2.8) [uncultured Gammaproteobacteria bacterium]SHN90221.1 Phosphoglucomutase @ Phosphomannomutase [Bathymodiolus heckerae thiotrophic gill symbiont]
MSISQSIFKAYDIRGIVEQELTPEAVKLIGLAIGSESIAKGERGVVVGRDGRLSGLDLMQALKTGLKESGCHVVDIGMVPTPLVYFSTYTKAATSGVMITGSHNPPEYNGFKIMIAGETLSGNRIQELYQRIINNDFNSGHGTSTKVDIEQDYIDQIKSDIKLDKPLHIVVDCGNGVAGDIAPKLFEQLGAKVTKLFCLIDGNFPNHHPDPSKLHNLEDIIKEVIDTGADMGFAFDGDGDRLGLIDNKGNVIWADRQMILYSRDILSRNPGAKIVFDVKCSSLLPKDITEHGGEAIMSRTGHSFIKAKLKETGSALGGEMSGHIFFKERWYGFDDALYTGARLLEIMSKTDQTCEQVFADLPDSINTPEINIHFDEQGQQFKAMDKLAQNVDFEGANIITIDGIRVDYPNGWGLVRPSNTTPCLVLRFEANDETTLETIKSTFRQWLSSNHINTDSF